MKKVTVSAGAIRGTVEIPSSKSYGHRLLIESLASGYPVTVKGNLKGDDIDATIGCLEAVGAHTERTRNYVKVIPPVALRETPVVFANESGSTLRFLMSVLPAIGVEATFTGAGELPARPVGALLDCLGEAGVTADRRALPFTLRGSFVCAPRFRLKDLKSSQDVSGLLMAMPLIGGASLEVEGALPSEGYVAVTLETLGAFGVKYEVKDGIYRPLTGYGDPGEVEAEGDWSSAAFIAAAGVLAGETETKGLKYPSLQPDSAIVELLKEAGADIEFVNGALVARKSDLHAVEFDADGCPDLVPIMSVALAAAQGVSVIRGVDRLRYKESDRIASVIGMLKAFGIRAEYADNALTIRGGKLRSGGVAYGAGDHRIAMSAAVAATAASDGGDTDIIGAECVSKSYSDFYEDLVKLGGKVYER